MGLEVILAFFQDQQAFPVANPQGSLAILQQSEAHARNHPGTPRPLLAKPQTAILKDPQTPILPGKTGGLCGPLKQVGRWDKRGSIRPLVIL
jgi:hypothetical protein